jgi:hypothetical protein
MKQLDATLMGETAMRTSVAALAIAAALATPALAQQGNTANPGSQQTTQPPMSMAPATQAPGGTAAPGTTTGPAASQSRAGTATQMAPQGSATGSQRVETGRGADATSNRAAATGNTGQNAGQNNDQAAVRTDNPGSAPTTTTTPASGANSFTEGQARSRIEAAGFSGVQDLKKDEAGVWRGRAMRGGQTADVGLDFQGNVVTGNAPAR